MRDRIYELRCTFLLPTKKRRVSRVFFETLGSVIGAHADVKKTVGQRKLFDEETLLRARIISFKREPKARL